MPDNRKGGGKRFLIRCGLFLLCVASAYGYGRWQGSRVVAGVQAQADAARDSATLRSAQGRAEAAELQGLVRILQARRRLDLALMALDERNFGTAADMLHAAGTDLAGTASLRLPAGADAAVLSRLAPEIQSAHLVAAEDFAQQRSRILGWIRDLDAQFPADAAPTGGNAHGEYGFSPQPASPVVPTGPAPKPGGEAPAAPAVPAPAPGGTQ